MVSCLYKRTETSSTQRCHQLSCTQPHCMSLRNRLQRDPALLRSRPGSKLHYCAALNDLTSICLPSRLTGQGCKLLLEGRRQVPAGKPTPQSLGTRHATSLRKLTLPLEHDVEVHSQNFGSACRAVNAPLHAAASWRLCKPSLVMHCLDYHCSALGTGTTQCMLGFQHTCGC